MGSIRGRGQAEKAAAFWSWFAGRADHGREIATRGPSPEPRFDNVDSIVCRHEDVALTCDDVEFSVIEMETPETGAVTLLVFFVRGLAGPRGDDVERPADQLLQIVLGEERALRWLEYSMTWDSEVREEKLEGIPRMPLAEIGKLFEELDPQIGPRR